MLKQLKSVVVVCVTLAGLVACGPPPVAADWSTDATEFTDRIGQEFTYACPPAGEAGPVWGTDTYTDDSSVCTAAVHAGEIDFATGGSVTIVIVAGLDSYTGSERNGVTTSDYGPWENAFQFVE